MQHYAIRRFINAIAPRIADDPEYCDLAGLALDIMAGLINPAVSFDPLGDR